ACFVCMRWRPPTSTLFPYTTLFRSIRGLAYRFKRGREGVMNPQQIEETNLKGKDFLTLADFSPETISELLKLAAELKAKHINGRSEEHTSELQSRENLVCRLLLEKK